MDWTAIHDEFRPKMELAAGTPRARDVLREMLSRLRQTHFAIVPGSVYADVEPSASDETHGDGSTGIDVRVLDGQAIVTKVDSGSSADRAGVKPGWEIDGVSGVLLAPLIDRLKKDPSLTGLTLERAVQSRIGGPIGETGRFAFLDGSNHLQVIPLVFAPREESFRVSEIFPRCTSGWRPSASATPGYIAFNMFLDLVHVMTQFGNFVESCSRCDGLVIDLRGNPGGIGGMAMGMAGWLVDKPDQKLGTMLMRDVKLNFVINPRAQVFTGPVAILVDGSSASTSEIFAGGLKIWDARGCLEPTPRRRRCPPFSKGFRMAMGSNTRSRTIFPKAASPSRASASPRTSRFA